jgi:putative hemolysin
VFFDEMGASAQGLLDQLDADPYDALCDHLLVIDEDQPGTLVADGAVVGTYRLLRESVARAAQGFYSAGEFDLAPLMAGEGRVGGELLELGRSCVLPAFRTSATISLLWRGIADYIAAHDIGLMFGCASFPASIPMPMPRRCRCWHTPAWHRPRSAAGAPQRRLRRGARTPAARQL